MDKEAFSKYFRGDEYVTTGTPSQEIIPNSDLFESLKETNPYAPFLIDTFLSLADPETIRAVGWHSGSISGTFFIRGSISGQEEDHVMQIEGDLSDSLTLDFLIPHILTKTEPVFRLREKIKFQSDESSLNVNLSLTQHPGPYDSSFEQWMATKFVPEVLGRNLPQYSQATPQ